MESKLEKRGEQFKEQREQNAEECSRKERMQIKAASFATDIRVGADRSERKRGESKKQSRASIS